MSTFTASCLDILCSYNFGTKALTIQADIALGGVRRYYGGAQEDGVGRDQ
jgi:hypothetical protein